MSAGTSQPQTELRAFVANCLMGGDNITQTGDSWIRDLVVFDCGGYQFRFSQKPEVINGNVDQFKGRFFPTTEVVVSDIRPGQGDKVKAALGRICWLLSFAGGCRVICYGHEYPNGSGLTHFISVSGIARYFRPAFEIQDGTQVKVFVEQTYETYRRLEKLRNLNIVIDYLIQADRAGQPTEICLVLIFVTLESLKDTFARSQSIPYRKGYFRKPPIKPGKEGAKYSFEELVTLMLRQVGMRRGVKRLVKLRNDLIHSGLSRKPHKRQWALYADIHDLIREYMLRLLGYRGRYSPYAFERRGRSLEIR